MTDQPELPKGLRRDPAQGPTAYLIQLSREGQRLTRRFKGTSEQALRALERAKVDLGKKIASPPPAPDPTISGSASSAPLRSCPTLAEFLVNDFKDHQERHQGERTRRKLEAPIRYLLASDLATMLLISITTASVLAYISWRLRVGALTFTARKDGAPYKPRTEKVSNITVNKSLRVLSTALNLALRLELIDRLPIIEFLPEGNARKRWAPSRAEYERIVTVAEELRHDAPWLPELVELIGQFGLRPTEALTLTWGSVAWEHPGNGTLGGAIFVEEQEHFSFSPKNRKRRLIPFTERGHEVLKKLYARMPPPKPTDLVIPNKNGLPYIRMDVPGMKGGGAGVWKKLQALTGLPVTMYGLRHYAVQDALSSGVPLHGVSKWVGHSKVELTAKTYGDFAPDNADQWTWAARRSG